MYKDMLPAFHKILSSILVLIPVFIFFYDIFLFYFHKKNKINQSLTSDSLKLFKDKFLEIKVPLARKNLEAQAMTGYKNITSDLIEYLLDKNVKNLNFTLYIFSKAINYISLKRIDSNNDSSNLAVRTEPPMYFGLVNFNLKFIFISFVIYFWASTWFIDLFITF